MFYLNNEQNINTFLSNFNGTKSDVYVKNISEELDNIRFSVVFSDITNIYPIVAHDNANFIIPTEGKRQITLPYQVFNKFIHEDGNPIIHAAYAVKPDEELNAFFKIIEPLIESQLALVHNSKAILGLTEEEKNGRPRSWEMYDVISPNSIT